MVEVDFIVNACIELYKKLPKTGKPNVNEWTVISAIVGVFNDKEVKVLSLGTGSKCIGKSLMSAKGDILNDSHSEVIARRAFLKYLYLQIIELNKTSKSEILEKDDRNNFYVKDSVKFYFITAMCPCGDASIMPKAGSHLSEDESVGLCLENTCSEAISNEAKRVHSVEDLTCKKKKMQHIADIHRTGAKCLPQCTVQDAHLPGLLYHNIGAVRTKPGRGDPTLSLSCSDKIAKWNAVGWQGALLSFFIEAPIFVEAIICGGKCPFSKESFDRAVNERINREIYIPIHQSNVGFPHQKGDGKKPNPSSIIWCASNGDKTEVSINGRRLGVTKKNFNKKIARTTICKKEFFILFVKAVHSLGDYGEFVRNNFGCKNEKSFKDITYAELKSRAIKYQKNWQICKENCFKVWSNKPKNLLDFTVGEEE